MLHSAKYDIITQASSIAFHWCVSHCDMKLYDEHSFGILLPPLRFALSYCPCSVIPTRKTRCCSDFGPSVLCHPKLACTSGKTRTHRATKVVHQIATIFHCFEIVHLGIVPSSMQVVDKMTSFRSAIYLNNIGCSLLEKNCHGDAHETFQDAILVMRLTCSTDPLQEHEKNSVSSSIDAKIRLADRRLSRPVASSVYLPLTAFSADTQSPSFQCLVATGEATVLAYHPIRIEVGEMDDLEKLGYDVLSAIILYNFAIASLCQTMLGTCPEELSKSFYRAMDLLSLANRILSNCKNPLQFLFVSLVSYETMARALMAAGLESEAEVYASILAGLKSTADKLFRVERSSYPKAACAA